MNGMEKSSRSKADYFEVLIADKLAKHYKVGKNFQREITELEEEIALAFVDGEYRIFEQKGRAKNTSEKLINFLMGERITKIKDVEWIGRYHQTKHTLSDVDLILDSNEKIGVSLKSVGSGLGTQKNLGRDSMATYLSLNIDKDLANMWNNIRKDLRKSTNPKIRTLAESSKADIYKHKRDYPIIKEIGHRWGHIVQVESVKQSVRNFNKLTADKRSEFLKVIFGVEDARRLLNVIAQPEEVKIYWNKVYDSMISGEGCEARKITDVGYGIYINNKRILTIQTCFTNGVGISPYCQRAFLTRIDDNQQAK